MLRAADPQHLAYVNLLPDYIPPAALGAPSYDDYVEQFVTTVRPQLLSYDYYPFGHEKDRSTFFTNLATMRAAALRHDLPFMLIVLAMPHGPYRDPSEAELAWQVHHALAYGARGVSYFTYWTPAGDEEWNNRYGLIENGRANRTLLPGRAAQPRAARARPAALDGFESIAVADSLGEIGVPFPIGPIDGIDGGPITAGLFGDGSGRLAVLLVNRDYRYGVTAQLRLRAGAAAPQVFDAGSATWAARTDTVVRPAARRQPSAVLGHARRAAHMTRTRIAIALLAVCAAALLPAMSVVPAVGVQRQLVSSGRRFRHRLRTPLRTAARRAERPDGGRLS